MFRCESVTRRFGNELSLGPFSYEFELGRVIGVVGPNGCGKTTLMNILSGLDRPSSGVCQFEGKETWKLGITRLARKGVFRIFQVPRVVEALTVRENLLMALETHSSLYESLLHGTKAEAGSAADFARLVGLVDKLGSPASTLSFGQKRRLTIGLVQGRAPLKAVLADEPLTGLDRWATEVVAEQLVALRAARGCLIVIADHKEDVLRSICDEVISLG